MKITTSPLLGEARGKLGSVVFSRNSAGAYVRVFVVPVNHRSTKQVNHRQAFSIGSAMWCTLTDQQKVEWHNYAKDPVRFTPVYAMNTGGISGQNAYIAHWLECFHGNNLQGNVTAVNSTPVGLSHKSTTLVVPSDPPALPVDGTIFGKPINFTCTITSGTMYTITTTITPVGGATNPITVPGNTTIKDGHGNNITFALYISSSKKNRPNYSKKLAKKIVSTGQIENNTPNPINVTSFAIVAQYNPANNFNFPQPGEFVDVTLAMVTIGGQVRKVGQFTTLIN